MMKSAWSERMRVPPALALGVALGLASNALAAAAPTGTELPSSSATPGTSDSVRTVVPGNPDSILTATVVAIGGEPLTLAAALDASWHNATSVRDADAAWRAARAAVRKEEGAFDPELFAEAARAGDASPASSPFAGASVLRTKTNTTVA